MFNGGIYIFYGSKLVLVLKHNNNEEVAVTALHIVKDDGVLVFLSGSVKGSIVIHFVNYR